MAARKAASGNQGGSDLKDTVAKAEALALMLAHEAGVELHHPRA